LSGTLLVFNVTNWIACTIGKRGIFSREVYVLLLHCVQILYSFWFESDTVLILGQLCWD